MATRSRRINLQAERLRPDCPSVSTPTWKLIEEARRRNAGELRSGPQWAAWIGTRESTDVELEDHDPRRRKSSRWRSRHIGQVAVIDPDGREPASMSIASRPR